MPSERHPVPEQGTSSGTYALGTAPCSRTGHKFWNLCPRNGTLFQNRAQVLELMPSERRPVPEQGTSSGTYALGTAPCSRTGHKFWNLCPWNGAPFRAKPKPAHKNFFGPVLERGRRKPIGGRIISFSEDIS